MSRLCGIGECPNLCQAIAIQLTPEKQIPRLLAAQSLLISRRALEKLLELRLIGCSDEAQPNVGNLGAASARCWRWGWLRGAAEGSGNVVGSHARGLGHLRLRRRRRRDILLLLLRREPGRLRLLLRRLEASRLRLLEAWVLGLLLLELILLLLRRISSRLGLQSTRGKTGILLLQWLLLAEASRLLRLKG